MGQLFDGELLNFRNFDYVGTHLKHLSKCEAEISDVWVACNVWKFLCLVISVHNIVPFEQDTLELLRKKLISTRQIWVLFW